MLDSWVNVSSGNDVTKKVPTNPMPSNMPTYNQPHVGQMGGNNDNGEYNWLFGIRQ